MMPSSVCDRLVQLAGSAARKLSVRTPAIQHQQQTQACLASFLPLPSAFFLREVAPPGRGCVVWTVGLVSAPSYPRHLSRPHHQSHTAHDTVEPLARGHRRSSCTHNIKNNSTPPRHPVSSPVASRVSALLPPVGGDAVKPSSVPDDVGAKCSGSCGLW